MRCAGTPCCGIGLDATNRTSRDGQSGREEDKDTGGDMDADGRVDTLWSSADRRHVELKFLVIRVGIAVEGAGGAENILELFNFSSLTQTWQVHERGAEKVGKIPAHPTWYVSSQF